MVNNYNYTITIRETDTSFKRIARFFFNFVGCTAPLSDSFLGKTPLAFLDIEKMNSDRERGIIRALDKYALDPEKLRTHREVRKFETEEGLNEFANYLRRIAPAGKPHSPIIQSNVGEVLFSYTTASGKANAWIKKSGQLGYESGGYINLNGSPDIIAKKLTDSGIDVDIEVHNECIDLNELASALRKKEMTVRVSVRKHVDVD